MTANELTVKTPDALARAGQAANDAAARQVFTRDAFTPCRSTVRAGIRYQARRDHMDWKR